MQLHTQKVELTETLRFSFLPAMSLSSLLHQDHNFSFPFTLVTWMWLLSFHSLGHQRGQQQICAAQSNTNSAQEDPTCSAEVLGKKLILGSAFLNPLSPGFDSHCRTISGAEINDNVEFSLRGMVPRQTLLSSVLERVN